MVIAFRITAPAIAIRQPTSSTGLPLVAGSSARSRITDIRPSTAVMVSSGSATRWFGRGGGSDRGAVVAVSVLVIVASRYRDTCSRRVRRLC